MNKRMSFLSLSLLALTSFAQAGAAARSPRTPEQRVVEAVHMDDLTTLNTHINTLAAMKDYCLMHYCTSPEMVIFLAKQGWQLDKRDICACHKTPLSAAVARHEELRQSMKTPASPPCTRMPNCPLDVVKTLLMLGARDDDGGATRATTDAALTKLLCSANPLEENTMIAFKQKYQDALNAVVAITGNEKSL